MKKSLLLVFFSFLSTFNFAQVSSNLVIFSEDANLFYLVVNGVRQNVEPQSNIKLTGLTGDAYQLNIVFANASIKPINQAFYFHDKGVESTLKISKHKKKGYRLVYFGETTINGGTNSGGNGTQWTGTYSTTAGTASTGTGTNAVSGTNGNGNMSANGNMGNGSMNGNGNMNSGNGSVSGTGTINTGNGSGAVSVIGNGSSSKGTMNGGSRSSNGNMSGGNGTSNSGNGTNGTGSSNGTMNSGMGTSSGTTTTQAANLNYNWVAGSAHQFSATVTDKVSTSMMGINMNDQFVTTSDFVLGINSVAANGTANGTLYLINFKITDSRGGVLATINDIPKKFIQSEVTVDRKGHFTFLKKVYLITSATGNVLAYGNADGNSVQMGGQAGTMKVDAYAEFNPKTGALKTGYTVNEIKNTRKVDVAVNEETDMIDVFPYDFLDLLALPDGAVGAGDQVTVKDGIYSINIAVKSMNNGVATLNNTMSTDKSGDLFGGSVKGNQGNSNIDMDMNNLGQGVEGMEGMNLGEMMKEGMTEEDKKDMDMAKGMMPEISCNITSEFNFATGMFQQVYGTVDTAMNMMGMKITVNSVLQMRKL